MNARLRSLRLAGLGLLLGTAAASGHAEVPGLDALIRQAQYWRAKGREDLAQQALRRARALAPGSAAVARAAAGPTPAPAPGAAPAAKRALAPAPARSPANRGGGARAAGFAALDRGDLDAAAVRFGKALAANPRDADALGGMGLVRLRQNRFAEAARLLEQAARLGRAAQWADALGAARFFAGIAQARGLLAGGRLGDAQAIAEQLVRAGYKEPAPALELLADIYERQGREADAAELYRQAGQTGRGGAREERRLALRAARGRALAAAERGDDGAAEREFQNGLLLDPDDPWIRYEFARFMIRRGRVPEAESLLRSLMRPDDADSLYAAAMLDAELGRTGEAERLLDQIPEAERTAPMRSFAIGIKTDRAIARARALAAGGRQAEALSALRQLGAVPAMPPARQAAIASALLDLGDTAGAADLAEHALDGVSGLDDYAAVVPVLARAGREDLARLALQRAGGLAGTSPEGQQAYARMSAGLAAADADRARLAGRFAEAYDLLQAAWRAAPGDGAILSALARLYQSGAMPGPAAQTFKQVLAREPGDRDALLGLAQTAQAAGDRALSEQAQASALRAFPADYAVRAALARVEQARGNDRAALRLMKEARALYARSQTAGSAAGSAGNPFAGSAGPAAGNPFRQPAAAVPANPFASGDGGQPSVFPAAYETAAPAFPAPGARSAPAPFAPATPAAAAFPGETLTVAAAPGVPGAYSPDPVMARIEAEIATLSHDTGPRVDVATAYRRRSGETGLSALDEIKGSAELSTSLAGGRIHGRAEATVIDAGRPAGSGLARFGRNATPEAQAIVDQLPSPLVDADAQHRSGVALAVGYKSDLVELEVGTTPLGFGRTRPTARAAVSPRLSDAMRARAWVERKPVTDSVVSYAGARDPVTGELWGAVMRTGGGAGLSWDQDGSGAYAEARYNRFTGRNVRRNSGVEANVGGYLRAWKGEHASLTAGLNVNYQAYDNSQNYFTFGHGGYFSPQSFLSVSVPIRYALETPSLDVKASLSPGFQSYSQDEAPLYPTDAAAQDRLDALKALDTDVRSAYDSFSKTGFALSAEASLYYRVGPNTQIGGEASYNSFGSYDEFRSMVGLRQSLGSSK